MLHTYDAAVLRASGVPALVVWGAAVVVSGALGGGDAAGGALLAGAVVNSACAVTWLLCSLTRPATPASAMAVGAAGFLMKVWSFGVLLAVSGSVPVFQTPTFPATMGVLTLTWIVAELRAFTVLRTPYVEPVGWPAREVPQATSTRRRSQW